MRLNIKSSSYCPSLSQSREHFSLPSVNLITNRAQQSRFKSMDNKDQNSSQLNFVSLGQPTHTILHLNKNIGRVSKRFQKNPFTFKVKALTSRSLIKDKQVSIAENYDYDKYNLKSKPYRSIHLYDPYENKDVLEWIQLHNVNQQIQKKHQLDFPEAIVTGRSEWLTKINELDEQYFFKSKTKRFSIVKNEIVQNLNTQYQIASSDLVDENYLYSKHQVKQFIAACKKSDMQQIQNLLLEDKKLINSRDYFHQTGLH